MKFRRVVWVILDSVGAGAMPDAPAYGDTGADTLGHLASRRPLALPNLCGLGLGNIRHLDHLPPAREPQACFGRCALASPGKDTTTGHWEMVGILLERPFPTYPNGFPPEIMDEFQRLVGRPWLGNCTASGTEIIERLGPEHLRTGYPIVYTSADSVFQIATHEDVVPLAELYRMCEIARELLRGPHEVGRVIARPFTGEPGAFQRDQAGRHDYAIQPPAGMLLDALAEAGVPVWAVGKIHDIFLGRGIARHFKSKSNAEGMGGTLAALEQLEHGLIFTNLVDFDSLYGHRLDPEGYSQALEAADVWIGELLGRTRPGDLVILNADHGNDPTSTSTDHSREYVPLLVWGPRARRGVDLGTRATLADIGRSVADNFEVNLEKGRSFLSEIV